MCEECRPKGGAGYGPAIRRGRLYESSSISTTRLPPQGEKGLSPGAYGGGYSFVSRSRIFNSSSLDGFFVKADSNSVFAFGLSPFWAKVAPRW